jgi:hypothetical protein
MKNQPPTDFPSATQKMIWDSTSGWSAIGLFQGDNLVGWFNADAEKGGVWEMIPNLATDTPEATAIPNILEGNLAGLATAPDMTVDAAGLHITLPDSSRVVDIAPGDVSKEVVFDSEYNLFKIYDASGNITAEYDPGQGKVGDADYVPSTGWVDVQKLAKDLACQGDSCIFHEAGIPIPDEVTVNLNSTGIFRYVDALDKNTGEKIGKFLLSQMVTKENNNSNYPSAVWVLVQGESDTKPGENAYPYGLSTIKYRAEGKMATSLTEFLSLNSIDQWQKWIPKESKWALDFSESGFPTSNHYVTFIEKSQLDYDTNVVSRDFLSRTGNRPQENVVLVLITSSVY